MDKIARWVGILLVGIAVIYLISMAVGVEQEEADCRAAGRTWNNDQLVCE